MDTTEEEEEVNSRKPKYWSEVKSYKVIKNEVKGREDKRNTEARIETETKMKN